MNNSIENLESRVEELEIKLTLLENANEQMSQVMIDQQATIDKLTLQLESARRQMEQLGESIQNDTAPPPHY